jgi:hypothetical protein
MSCRHNFYYTGKNLPNVAHFSTASRPYILSGIEEVTSFSHVSVMLFPITGNCRICCNGISSIQHFIKIDYFYQNVGHTEFDGVPLTCFVSTEKGNRLIMRESCEDLLICLTDSNEIFSVVILVLSYLLVSLVPY